MKTQLAIQEQILTVRMKLPDRMQLPDLLTRVRENFGDTDGPSDSEIAQAFWRLVSFGLIFPKFEGVPMTVQADLTPRGRAVALDSSFDPDFPPKYLERLRERVPLIGLVAEKYVREAMDTFAAGAYLATAVMLGVASEGMILEMAEALAEWLEARGTGTQLKDILASKKTGYVYVLKEVRKQIGRASCRERV